MTEQPSEAEQPSANLTEFLHEHGLEAAEARPRIAPDPDHPLVKQADQMEAWMIQECTDQEALDKYRRALRLYRVSAVYNPADTSAPVKVTQSIDALLDLYIDLMGSSIKDGEVAGEELMQSLVRLSLLSFSLGYVLKAMEDDGRWVDLDPPKLT